MGRELIRIHTLSGNSFSDTTVTRPLDQGFVNYFSEFPHEMKTWEHSLVQDGNMILIKQVAKI